jgi:hypothetical protein
MLAERVFLRGMTLNKSLDSEKMTVADREKAGSGDEQVTQADSPV